MEQTNNKKSYRFVKEFNRIHVTGDGFVDYDALHEFRAKWYKKALEVEALEERGCLDPDEAFHFADGSVAVLANPKQEVYAASAYDEG